MCGRYVLKQNLAEICAAFGLGTALETLAPSYNAAPETLRPIMVKNRLGHARWGWPVAEGLSPVINIRSETMADKPMFAPSVRRGQRCVVPASGFYEWDASGQPFYVESPDAPLLGLAGLWVRDPDHSVRFAILTRAALTHLAPIHPRMPVTLTPQNVHLWIADGIMPEPPTLAPYPVDPGVNVVANDSAALLDRLAAAPQGNLFAAG